MLTSAYYDDSLGINSDMLFFMLGITCASLHPQILIQASMYPQILSNSYCMVSSLTFRVALIAVIHLHEAAKTILPMAMATPANKAV